MLAVGFGGGALVAHPALPSHWVSPRPCHDERVLWRGQDVAVRGVGRSCAVGPVGRGEGDTWSIDLLLVWRRQSLAQPAASGCRSVHGTGTGESGWAPVCLCAGLHRWGEAQSHSMEPRREIESVCSTLQASLLRAIPVGDFLSQWHASLQPLGACPPSRMSGSMQ